MVSVQTGAISSILDAFPVRPVLEDEQMLENVRSALGRGLPGPSLCRPHDTLLSIAAGGPSLEDTWRELDGAICAVNGSLRFLLEKNVTPWAVGCMDPRPHMADTLEARDGVFYFIASTCHPSVFEKLKNQQVILWHPLGMPGMMQEIGPRHGIGGGTTMGLRWLTLGHFMGFRKFHCHGLDSSFRGRATHAYPDWRDNFDSQELFGFKTSLNFIQQVQDWFELKAMFAREKPENQVSLKLFGEGLLQHCDANAPEPEAAPDEATAVYDLGKAPASWDFINWLQQADLLARNSGAKKLRVGFKPGPKDGFRDDGLPVDTKGRRQLLERVCKPLARLAGAEVVEDAEPTIEPASYLMRPVSDAARVGYMPKNLLAGVKPLRGDRPVVITLREAGHWADNRNSNLEAWKAFSRKLAAEGEHVVTVRDTAKAGEPLIGWDAEQDVDAAIDLEWRAKLYASAKCCLFTTNGPAHLAIYSHVPWLMFGPLPENFAAGTPEWWTHAIGVPPGTQYPWAGRAQRIIWQPDHLEHIETAWAALRPLLNQPAAEAA